MADPLFYVEIDTEVARLNNELQEKDAALIESHEKLIATRAQVIQYIEAKRVAEDKLNAVSKKAKEAENEAARARAEVVAAQRMILQANNETQRVRAEAQVEIQQSKGKLAIMTAQYSRASEELERYKRPNNDGVVSEVAILPSPSLASDTAPSTSITHAASDSVCRPKTRQFLANCSNNAEPALSFGDILQTISEVSAQFVDPTEYSIEAKLLVSQIARNLEEFDLATKKTAVVAAPAVLQPNNYCNLCKKTLCSPYNLKRHMKAHIHCEICDNYFSKQHNFDQHKCQMVAQGL